MNSKCPAYLIIGSTADTANFTADILKRSFCKQNCNGCLSCKKITDKAHENIIWLEPEKSYTKAQLDIIFEKCSFALEENEKFFFVIQQAELLNAASSNRLLKIVEEPPAGYNFLFLTSRGQDILPTIKSRCIVKELLSDEPEPNHELFEVLSQEQIDPAKFLQTLDKSGISEKESIALLEQLITYWTGQLKEKLKSGLDSAIAQNKVDIFSAALTKPPMSGSSKIFWKNTVIQLSS